MFDEDSRLKLFFYAAIFLTLLGYAGRYVELEPLHNQFFVFAAWAYVLFVDNVNYRFGGSSLAVSRTPEFLVLALWSLAISCIFELFNLRLGIWYYTNQPATLSTRWLGLALGRASFFPGLFVTAEFFNTLGLFRGFRTGRVPVSLRLLKVLYCAGACLLLLALAAPGLFWPLAGGAFFLIAEPLNYRLGLASLLREWEGGLPGKTLRLALAGLVCGFLWNAWNASAGAQWVCSVKLPGPQAFGLPLIAYSGFLILPLQAYSLCSLASALRGGKTWELGAWPMPGGLPGLRLRYVSALLIVITFYIALRAIDAHTIKLYLAWI